MPRSRIFRKYVVFFVALVAGALLASSAVELYFSYQENKMALGHIQREKARAAASLIEQFVGEIERQMGWTTHLSLLPLTSIADQLRQDYLRLLRQVPAITEIRYLDSSGHEQLHVSRLAMDVATSQEDFSKNPAFVEAKSKGVYYGPVNFRKGSEPYMTLAIAGPGRDAGINMADVNLKFVWDVVSGIRVGDAGYAYVVDRSGHLIAHPDISLVLRKTDLSSLYQVEAAREAVITGTEDAEPALVVQNLEGTQVLASHAAIAPLSWVVMVELPLSEAFKPLYSSVRRTSVLLLGGLILSVVASLVLARKMVFPIRALQAGASRIGSGELGHRIELRTGDELEVLANRFNEMAGTLQASYTHLEQRVEERTRELVEAHRTLQEQAARLQAQSAQLAEWNRTLETRVAEQLADLERMGRLKRFLSPQLAELIVAGGDEHLLESHRRQITVVFCDLRGFTPFAETAEPEEVMGVLREYHEALGALIFRFEGTLERFLGDGLMVLFNDPLPCPDPEARAVRMAVAMHECVAELSTEWKRHGHELGFGVGIAQGYATLGKVGFEGRFDYAAIGTVSNIASRLCAEASSGQTLISQSVYAAVEEFVVAELMGDLVLKGIHHPVKSYNVLNVR